MQSSYKEIYHLTALRTEGDEKKYKDIGNFIQEEAERLLRHPPSLIIKLKGLGHWYLRKARMERMLSYFPAYYEQEGYTDFDSPQALKNFQDKKKLYDNFKARLVDYEEYIRVRTEVRQLKHDYKKLHPLPPPGQSPSSDKPA